MKKNELFHYQLLDQEKLDFYNDFGFVKMGRTLTDKGIELMLEECMQAWNNEKQAFDANKTWLQNALLVNIHKKSTIVRDFYFEGPIVDVMEQIIGPNIKAATSQLTFKMRGNTKSFAWHQDNGYGELQPYNTISSLTALEDVDEENGCLRIIPGSHKQGQIDVSHVIKQHKEGKSVSIELEVDESKAIPIPMKAGESIFFHCWTLHQSQGNFSKDRDRRILFMRYADADAIEIYNNGQPRLGRLLKGTTQFSEVREFESDL